MDILTALGWVHQEYDERARTFRNRLSQGAVDAGLGYRLRNRDGEPFDRLTPAAVDWIAEELPNWLGLVGGLHEAHINEMREALRMECARRNRALDTEGQVRFLSHRFPNALQKDIALALSVSERQVRRCQKKMADQLARGGLRDTDFTEPSFEPLQDAEAFDFDEAA